MDGAPEHPANPGLRSETWAPIYVAAPLDLGVHATLACGVGHTVDG
jgi:hypothetical protein